MNMRKQGLVWVVVLLGLACAGSEVAEAPYPELRLAPGVTSVKNLAFSVAYGKESPKPCQRIIAYAYGSEGTRQEVWKIHARGSQRCPERFGWGQDMGAAWEVLTAPASPVLEPNHLYSLRIYLEGGGGRDFDFCIFQDGSVFVDYFGSFNESGPESTSRRNQIKRCQEE